ATAHRRTWTRHFDAPVDKIWTALADTARFNEASRFPKHRIEATPQPDGTVIYTAHAKFGPLQVIWRDMPQEWVVPRYYPDVRLFEKGPFKTFVATMRVASDNGGTRAEFTLEVKPATLLGHLMLIAGFFRGAGKGFFDRCDEAAVFAAGRRDEPFVV